MFDCLLAFLFIRCPIIRILLNNKHIGMVSLGTNSPLQGFSVAEQLVKEVVKGEVPATNEAIMKRKSEILQQHA